MCAKHQGGASRHIIQVFNEDGTTALEVIHHIGVVHNFVAHIHGFTKFQQRPVDDFYGAVNACTKAPRFGQYDFFKVLHSSFYKIPMTCTSNVTARPASGWLKSNKTESSVTC